MKRTIGYRQPPLKLDQAGSTYRVIFFGVIVLFCIFGVSRLVQSHAAADGPRIESGTAGYCLDVHNDQATPNATVDTWKCNGSAAQGWTANLTTITHDDRLCLSVRDNAKAAGSSVVLNACDGSPGQVWLRDGSGYQNPNSQMCLSTAASQPQDVVNILPCATPTSSRQTWSPTTPQNTSATTCQGSRGDKVACAAIKEWETWQNGSSNHEALLTEYTNGAAYEEWCADFVSYVYKEAGYPFTGGESDGWDESNANNIQNMGFTKHLAGSGYVPKVGDVAYFDYNGGHVEIVVSAGQTPTFVYGNSGTIDPTTGNGQMRANTFTSDTDGQLMYYLSP